MQSMKSDEARATSYTRVRSNIERKQTRPLEDYGRANGASLDVSAAVYTNLRVAAWEKH